MWKKIKALLALNLNDLCVALGFVAAPWVLVHLVTCVVMVVIRPDESIMISGMLLPITVGLACFAVTSGNTMVTFSQAVKFSTTRKTALKLTLFQTLLESALAMVLGVALLAFERNLAMPLWRVLSSNPNLLLDDFGFLWWTIPAGALAGYLGGLWYGTMVLRFGGKAIWFFMILWFACLTILQMLPWKTHEVTNILSPAACLTLLLCVVWSLRTLLHLSIPK